MIYSRTFKPAPAMCCQACVFSQGEHEPWCQTHVARYNRFCDEYVGVLRALQVEYPDGIPDPAQWEATEVRGYPFGGKR